MSYGEINIENVRFGYQKDELVFEDLSLSIENGQTIGVIGSNGAGKSTLLKILVGLEMHEMGLVKVSGIESTKKNFKAIRQKIGYAFQDADAQLFMTTVYEDVAFGPRNYGFSEVEVERKTKTALETVQAYHLKDKPPYKLSGGEKRSVTLATVLSMDPEIIVLDEPTTGLDPRGRRNLIELTKKLKQTKIIATHDMELAIEICDRVIVMHKGKITLDGKPEDVFKDKGMLEICHLEQPYSMRNCPVCGSR